MASVFKSPARSVSRWVGDATQIAFDLRRKGRKVTVPAPVFSELALHIAVADLLRWRAKPEWAWTHIPLGEARSDITGAKLKRMGTMPGWPDFLLWAPGGAAYGLEIKAKGGDLSPTQKTFAAQCDAHKRPYRVASSYEVAEACLREWGALK